MDWTWREKEEEASGDARKKGAYATRCVLIGTGDTIKT